MSTAQAVRAAIRRLPKGKPFTSERFLEHGSRSAVDRTLSRLAARGEIERLARGVFVRPRTSRFVGTVLPDVVEVVEAIARRQWRDGPGPRRGGRAPVQAQHPGADRARVPYQRIEPHHPDHQHHRQDGPHFEPPAAAIRRRGGGRRALRPLVSRQEQRDPGNGRHDRGHPRPGGIPEALLGRHAGVDEQGARRRPGPAPWLRHSGRLRRVPDDDQLPGLQADYDAMRAAAIIADDAPGSTCWSNESASSKPARTAPAEYGRPPLHGPLRRGGGAPDGLRPRAGLDVGGEAVPPQGASRPGQAPVTVWGM